MSHSFRTSSIWASLAATALLIVALPFTAWSDAMQHSGKILSLDRARGTLVLGEVGPWKVRDGATEITPRTIALVPSTEFALAGRVDGVAPSGWRGDFVELPSGIAALEEGRFVTVTVKHEGGRMTAEKVLLITP